MPQLAPCNGCALLGKKDQSATYLRLESSGGSASGQGDTGCLGATALGDEELDMVETVDTESSDVNKNRVAALVVME